MADARRRASSSPGTRRGNAGVKFRHGIIVVLVALATPIVMLTFSDRSTATSQRDHTPLIGGAVSQSPAGDLLITLRPDGHLQHLLVVPANGSEPRMLLPEDTFDGHQTEGVWSPDGSQAAFMVQYESSAGLHVVNADGSNLRLLAPAPPHEPQPERVLTQGSPAWSPDGTKIAFASSRAWDSGGLDIYVINADGTDLQRLTDDPSFEEAPRWSPDGSMITFEAFGWGNNRYGSTHIMNADGSERRVLIDAASAGDANWSPDGEWIAYTDGRFCCAVHIVRLDGTERHDLTVGGISGRWPRWSPDGTTLAWSAHENGGSLDGIFIYDLRTGETRLVSSVTGKLEWSPDGEWIAVAMAEIDTCGHPTRAGGLYLVRADGSELVLLQEIGIDEYDVMLDWRNPPSS
jgi:TolB protein